MAEAPLHRRSIMTSEARLYKKCTGNAQFSGSGKCRRFCDGFEYLLEARAVSVSSIGMEVYEKLVVFLIQE